MDWERHLPMAVVNSPRGFESARCGSLLLFRSNRSRSTDQRGLAYPPHRCHRLLHWRRPRLQRASDLQESDLPNDPRIWSRHLRISIQKGGARVPRAIPSPTRDYQGQPQSNQLILQSNHSSVLIRIRRYSICPLSPSRPMGPVAGTSMASLRISPLLVQ